MITYTEQDLNEALDADMNVYELLYRRAVRQGTVEEYERARRAPDCTYPLKTYPPATPIRNWFRWQWARIQIRWTSGFWVKTEREATHQYYGYRGINGKWIHSS